MNILDIIILMCSIPFILGGYKNGFIKQTISIFALLIGVWIAFGLGDLVGSWVYPIFDGRCDEPLKLANIAGFALVLVTVLLTIGLIGRIVEKIVLIIVPGWINRLLGVGLAVCKFLLLCCIVFLIFNCLNSFNFYINPKDSLFVDSTFYPMIESLSNSLLPSIYKILL